MAEKTLVLEGLPDDLDPVRQKLELYFRNKRRSGGEVLQIQEHPEDKRKALLVYSHGEDVKKVLEKRNHKIDLKALGVAEVTVKPLEEDKVEPSTEPNPKRRKLELSQSAQAHTFEHAYTCSILLVYLPFFYMDLMEKVGLGNSERYGNEEDSVAQDLLVSTTESVDKDMLIMYFEQFTEHVEITKHGKDSWILKAAKQSDVLKILGQKKHEFGVSVRVYEEGNVSEKWDPRRFILTGFKDTCKCNIITVFIGSCSQKAEHAWELLDDDRIVITFREDIDGNSFIKKCTTKKLKDMEIGASHLELTDSILVEGDMSNFKEDILTLYFSNKKRSGGGDIKSLIWVNKNKSAVISFEESHVAQQVVEQKHHICNKGLSALLFYPSLQKALTGKTPALSNIPTEIIIPVDEKVLDFIERNEQCKTDFQDRLKKVHANVFFDKTRHPREIKLELAVDKESLAALRVGPTWESKAKREADAFLNKYGTSELAAEVEVWKRVEEDCLQFINFDVDLSFEEAPSIIVVVGLKEAMGALVDKIQTLLQEAIAEVEVERNTMEKAIPLESKEMLQLVANQVYSRISSEITFTKDESTLTFRLKGLKDAVSAAERIIRQAKDNVVLQNLSLSPHLLHFLKSLDLKKFEQDHFIPNQIPAFFKCSGDLLGILLEKQNIKKAEQKLSEILKEEVIRVAPDLTTLFNSEKWDKFFRSLKDVVELSHNAHNVRIISSDGEIVICGFAQVVTDLSRKVRDYLKNQTPATEDVPVKTLRELEFIDDCMNLSEIPEIRDLGVTILTCGTKSSPCLKVMGAKEKIIEARNLVNKYVSSIVTETLTYSKAGESKVIHKNEANVKAKAKEWNCKIYLSEKAGSPVATASASSSNAPPKSPVKPVIPKPGSDTEVKIGGVRIEVKKGSITNETVKGIVNTTNDQMNLTRGVSGAIFGAAGPSVQQECQTHGPLQSDTAAVTSGGKLQCDYIIHIMGPHSAADARLRVKKVLERCEEKQISTVSFPAVGTGGGGLKGSESVTAMLQGFDDHLSHCTSTAIKLIYIVIDRDEILQEYLQGLKQWTTKSQDSDDGSEECDEDKDLFYGSDNEIEDEEEEGEEDEEEGEEEEDEEEEEEDEEEEEEEEDARSGATTEALIGQVKVKVLCGDITKETTEAIVSSTNTSLDLRSGKMLVVCVSGAILKAAGQTVVEECNKLGTQPSDGVVLTKAGDLPFKNIVHMVGQTSEAEITRCMYNVLKKCEENKIQSVSFPALGTGAGNLAAAQVAKAMIDALTKFSNETPAFLKTTHIVIFQKKMFTDFEDALKKSKRISPKSSSATNPRPIIQAQSVSQLVNPPLCLAKETASVIFPVMNVEVYGTSPAELAKVKKFLDDLICEECISNDVQSSHLPSLPEADKQAIVVLSQSNQVRVHVAAADKLTVSGKKDDVLDAMLKINNFLQQAKERELQEAEAKRLSETLRWEVAVRDSWVPLKTSISYQMELAFHNKEQKFTYQEKGETYDVDFKDLKRVNRKGQSCKVRRTLLGDSETAIIHPPPTWTKMDKKDLEIIALLPNSEEYKKIEKTFLNSSRHKDVAPVQVKEIHRIQSQSQWQRYFVLKQAVDKKYPRQTNESFLYHGTTKEISEKINKNGFNRSFCGRNAVSHGDGTYFAKEAWYSCQDQYSNPDVNGFKYIYRARVVTGSPCKSRKRMKEPDPLDPNNPQAGLYDCAVDNLQNPFIHVVFCDAGAYPDYLIVFKNQDTTNITMAEETLELEGLPDDLDCVRTTLALYFQSKRRSGGEAARIQEHPEDRRKALLIYLSEAGSQQVLRKGAHHVDFKDLGTVQLTVKQLKEGRVQSTNSKPPILPKPKLETLTGKALLATAGQPDSKRHR
ncbi:hypothetical protein NFI96_019081, partial [Prochilodus magdalenae]